MAANRLFGYNNSEEGRVPQGMRFSSLRFIIYVLK